MLVHCHAGVSRSATVCMAYVMKSLNYDLRSAYDFVKRKRSCVSPNLHFMGQLLEFEKRLGVCAREDAGGLPCSMSCVEEEEEERERPHSFPISWVSKDKRRAVSTPASLETSPYTVPSRKPALSPCWATPTPVPQITPHYSSSQLCTLAPSHTPAVCSPWLSVLSPPWRPSRTLPAPSRKASSHRVVLCVL